MYWRECEIGGPRIRHDVDLGDTLGWILTLCIFEDHSSEKTHMIANMDAVYTRAVLTIVSAQDEHANAGLLGVDSGTRPAPTILDYSRDYKSVYLRRHSRML